VAGALLGPLLAVQVGMARHSHPRLRRDRHRRHRLDPRALVGSLLVGIVDTIGRAFLPILFGLFSAESGERRRAGDRLGARLPADGGGAVLQAAGTLPARG